MNTTPKTSAFDFLRTHRLLILGVLLLATAIAVTVGRVVSSRMRQARLTQDRPKDLQYGVKVYSSETADKAQETRAKYLAKANLLRGHWRVWAVAHRDLLRQLRQAPPNDYATLMRVYQALPYRLNASTGVTAQDVGIDVDDLNAGRGVFFGWQPTLLKTRVPTAMIQIDPHAQAKSDHYDDTLLQKLRVDFTNYRGIMLSESMSPGSSRVTLWADGRVTEMIAQDQRIVGKPTVIAGPEKQIVPPYDFLK